MKFDGWEYESGDLVSKKLKLNQLIFDEKVKMGKNTYMGQQFDLQILRDLTKLRRDMN